MRLEAGSCKAPEEDDKRGDPVGLNDCSWDYAKEGLKRQNGRAIRQKACILHLFFERELLRRVTFPGTSELGFA